MTSERMARVPFGQCIEFQPTRFLPTEACDEVESDRSNEPSNTRRGTVYLRELLASGEFEHSGAKLPLALGRTVDGTPVILSLESAQHLLVAGTTNSGMSTAINAMILSLLCRLKPDQCRIIMIDHMLMQFYDYDGIPHLLAPIISDMKEAIRALNWAMREAEERSTKMAKLGVSNIEGYNQYVPKLKDETAEFATAADLSVDGKPERGERQVIGLTPMHHIVIVINEIADLTIVEGPRFKEPIMRLAQIGRPAGIHLIVTTQRPSANVITESIRENFPSRLCFQLTTKTDSCVVLGESGAEQLLDQGDALLKVAGLCAHLQGAFVSEEEVEQVVRHLKALGGPIYLDVVLAGEMDDEDRKEAWFEDDGDFYDQALEMVMCERRFSVPFVQRRLGIGYNRATRIVKRMEKEGIVGPANHAGKREILVYSRDVRNGDEESQDEEE